jgi:thiamine-phosphate diphosphorylase
MVRKMLGPQKILGVSVKTPAEAAKALADGADYIGVGAVYPTGTKAASVIGVEGLKTVCNTSGLPVVAIGGVGVGNAGVVLGAGAQGLAVVSAVFAAPNVQVATRQLWEAVAQAQQQQQGQQQQQEEEAEAAAVVAVAVGQ